MTGTEARNAQRLEPRLKGHMVDTRVGFVTAAGAESVRDLNPHVNHGVLPGTQAERDSAIGIPTAVAFSSDGQRAYGTESGAGVYFVRVKTEGGRWTRPVVRVR